MKTIKETIKVEISNLKIDDEYYSFDYKVWRKGKLVTGNSYESDYDVPKKAIEEDLTKNGYAVELALVQAFE